MCGRTARTVRRGEAPGNRRFLPLSVGRFPIRERMTKAPDQKQQASRLALNSRIGPKSLRYGQWSMIVVSRVRFLVGLWLVPSRRVRRGTRPHPVWSSDGRSRKDDQGRQRSAAWLLFGDSPLV